ncbi:hypothetical protein EW146_g4386 [Bondarzewia mesenterica]|uniref:O-methyltransferase C-terminal domain-containing protein n=1 Tax=Bondarzewia mesenterica TaxID=1095465 RepID=A0A4S4M0H9_9AGAM|nr:hypothetical protein EW146_g4386 [Bondarzewia mesenterica]
MLNGKKMSKSTGNSLTMRQGVEKFGADATRLALADAGDGIEDANFDEKNANANIEMTQNAANLRTGPHNSSHDNVIEQGINDSINVTESHYEATNHKDALKYGFYELQTARDWYREVTSRLDRHTNLVTSTSGDIWTTILKEPTSTHKALWPTPSTSVDKPTIDAGAYMRGIIKTTRDAELALLKRIGKAKGGTSRNRAPYECDQGAWDAEKGKADDARVRELLTQRGLIKEKRVMPFVKLFKRRIAEFVIKGNSHDEYASHDHSRKKKFTEVVIEPCNLGNDAEMSLYLAMAITIAHKDKLRSLLALINSATEDAIRQYELAGLDVPSLESATESQLPEDTTALKKSLRILQGACHQLCTTLAPPALTIQTRSLATADIACLRVVVNANVADVIADRPEGMHIQEIAAKTHLEGEKLMRIMRNLAATHCFREISPGTFVNNPISLTLRQSNPLSAMVKTRVNEFNKIAMSHLYDAMVDPEYGHSSDARRSPFSYGIKEEIPNGTMFDWLGQHPESSKRFHRSMVGYAQMLGHEAVIKQFPWVSLPQGATVCDVGGGTGTVSMELAKTYQNLRLTLQDVPGVLEQAKQIWKKDYPVAVEEHRIDFVPFDFLQESPVRGQDIYYIRQIIHDWPADDCVRILRNVREAMKPGSRVLIHEYILPSNSSGATSLTNGYVAEKAPEPLLPNYGFGGIRSYLQDVNMLVLLNAGERTLEEFADLGARAGLRFVKLWDFVDTGLVEFEAEV